eukprot:3532455-Rhodomonas_salina.2
MAMLLPVLRETMLLPVLRQAMLVPGDRLVGALVQAGTTSYPMPLRPYAPDSMYAPTARYGVSGTQADMPYAIPSTLCPYGPSGPRFFCIAFRRARDRRLYCRSVSAYAFPTRCPVPTIDSTRVRFVLNADIQVPFWTILVPFWTITAVLFWTVAAPFGTALGPFWTSRVLYWHANLCYAMSGNALRISYAMSGTDTERGDVLGRVPRAPRRQLWRG